MELCLEPRSALEGGDVVRCTKPKGHDGDHVATVGPWNESIDEHRLAAWPADDPKATKAKGR